MYVKFISVPDFDLCSLIFAVHFLGMANTSESTFYTAIFLNFKNGFTCSRKQVSKGTPESSVKSNDLLWRKKVSGDCKGLYFIMVPFVACCLSCHLCKWHVIFTNVMLWAFTRDQLQQFVKYVAKKLILYDILPKKKWTCTTRGLLSSV